MTDIQKQIKIVIINDLNKKDPQSQEDVWRYRDSEFLSGAYDHLFLEYIKKKKLQ